MSSDGGASFPAQLVETTAQLTSVESAATRPDTIYATTSVATAGPGAALFRSTDGGASWQRTALQIPTPVTVRILAVSPTDPDTLWLRASYLSANGDEVLASSDGGTTFTSIYRAASPPITGFARGADGTLFLADGQPGVLARAPAASSFTRLPGPHLLCLFAQGPRLYACTDGVQDASDVATSDDGGATWKPLLSLSTLLGPATCPAVATACAADWQFQQALLGSARQKVAASGCGCRGTGAGGFLVAAVFLVAQLGRRRRRKGGPP
jgi:uncharacterized protein (TIGR03382 family)